MVCNIKMASFCVYLTQEILPRDVQCESNDKMHTSDQHSNGPKEPKVEGKNHRIGTETSLAAKAALAS